MNLKSIAFVIGLLHLVSGISISADFTTNHGPIPTRNYHPAQLIFMSIPVEEANPLPAKDSQVRFGLAESNTIGLESHNQINATIKVEILRSTLDIRYGLYNNLEIGAEIPAIYRYGGFLDPFIKSVERAFNSLNEDRLLFSDNDYRFSVRRTDDKILIQGGRRQFGISDISLRAKYLLFKESEHIPALALRGAIKFPTGDKDRTFGSGKVDYGLGFASQKSFNVPVIDKLIFYANINTIFPLGKFGPSSLTLDPFYTASVSGEIKIIRWFSLIGQYDYFTSPFHGTGTVLLNKAGGYVSLGLSFMPSPKSILVLGAMENVTSGRSAPDATLFTNLSFRF